MRTNLSILLLALAAAACGGDDPVSPRETKASFERFGNLEQTVSITPASPLPGEYLTIRSAIVNRGSAAVNLSSRICGLDYAGTLQLDWPSGFAKCAAYSMEDPIAVGDSVVTSDLMQVGSQAGTYVLRVRHALEPEAWVDVQVEVRRR